MERFNALGRGAQLMLIAGVLLFIDLFLPWQDFDVGGIADELAWTRRSAVGAVSGVVLGLLTIVLLAWLAVRLASVNIPLPVSTAMTGALIGALIAAFGVIKLLTILGDEATIWAWIGTILAILVAVGLHGRAGSRRHGNAQERDTEQPTLRRHDGEFAASPGIHAASRG